MRQRRHGGSLRIFGCHEADASKPATGRVAELLEHEQAAGLADLDRYRRYGERVADEKRDILEFLIEGSARASASSATARRRRGNTLLRHPVVKPAKINAMVPSTEDFQAVGSD